MKTFFAQWKRDILSQRTLLSVWAVCVGVIVAVGYGSRLTLFHPSASHPSVADPKDIIIYWVLPIMSVFMLSMLLLVVQGLLLLLLVSGLVHADPLTEPDAFWRTRPIPRRILLGEKLAFVTLLTAGSILAASAFHFTNPPPGPMFWHGVIFVASLMAFASVTSNFSQIVVNFLGLALGAKILAAIILAVIHGEVNRHGGDLNLSGGHPASDWIPIFSLVCFLAVIFCQYLTSRTNLCRFLLFAVFLVTTLWQGR